MAITTWVYGSFAKKLIDGTETFNFTSDNIRGTLHTAGYTPDVDTHEFYDDLTNELPTASGYTASGQTLSSMAVTYNTASNRAEFAAANLAWVFSTATTFRYLVLRKDTGVTTSSALIGYIDFGADKVASSTATVRWSSSEAVLQVRAINS